MKNATWTSRLVYYGQWALPGRLLTRLAGALAQSRIAWFKNGLIRLFIARYKVDLDEAMYSDLRQYPNFNAFFIRTLRPGTRPQDSDHRSLIAPCDGEISAAGTLGEGLLIQAKGYRYPLSTLIAGDDDEVGRFLGGEYLTIYLAPCDYHRVHMPLAGRLQMTRHIPGRLFSVHPKSVAAVPDIYTRNERLYCRFALPQSDRQWGLVMVGALLVAGIETVWAGRSSAARRVEARDRFDPAVMLQRGMEMARFNYGSTVILLVPPGTVRWRGGLEPGRRLKTAEALGWLNG